MLMPIAPHWRSVILLGHMCSKVQQYYYFQKEKADMEKLKRLLKPEELTATQQTQQERMQYLDQVYQELEAHYKKTIEKMAAS